MRPKALLTLGAIAGAIFTTPADALHWNLDFRFCPEEIVRLPPLLERFPIPVGCEIVDCCPGCPGPGLIDWRIRYAGQSLAGAFLRLDGLSEAELRALRVSGNARLEQGGIRLMPGESVIAGLPFASRERVAVAHLVPEVKAPTQVPDQAMTVGGEHDAGPDDESRGPSHGVRSFIVAFQRVTRVTGSGLSRVTGSGLS